MLKVFLVEDELIIREGIKTNIDWEAHGYDFCGEAPDGELAYPMILEKRPDIIITDIKMPFVDGIELSRLVVKELPNTKIIILSGHEDFEYAREAIRLGIAEYLTKPINRVELVKAIDKVAEHIYMEQKASGKNQQADNMQHTLEYKKKELFKNIIKGKLGTAAILQNGKQLGMYLSASTYMIVLFRYTLVQGNITDKEETVEAMIQRLVDESDDLWLFEQGALGEGIIIMADSEASLEQTKQKVVDQLEEIFKVHGAQYYGGIGKIVDRLSQLHSSYEVAEKVLSLAMQHKYNCILTDESFGARLFPDESALKDLDLGSIDFSKTEAFLRNGERDQLSKFMESFHNEVGEASEQSILFKQYVLMNLYITISAFIKEVGLEGKGFIELTKTQVTQLTYDDSLAKQWMYQMMDNAMASRDEARYGSFNKHIEKAKAYIEVHYHDDDMSLNDVASYVGLSPSHFSTVFSNHMGKSFIRYLIDLRMDEAKRLLKCSDMKCSIVGASVGYKDPHYFSYIFKKETGASPMKYRDKR